ncbi:MAG TPA: hypothetical protein VMI56_25335 [Reyranella sp.]|nr:hypothetical protein [Reyranella sp.]
MLNGLVRRLFQDDREPALWAIAVRGRIVGSMVREAGELRLAWFDGADPRLSSYAGPVDDSAEALASRLTARLGTPVELDLLAV